MLGVVQDANVHPVRRQRFAEGGDRSVADTADGHLVACVVHDDIDRCFAVNRGILLNRDQGEAPPGCVGIGKVLVGERRPHVLRRYFPALGVGQMLNHLGELDLESAR